MSRPGLPVDPLAGYSAASAAVSGAAGAAASNVANGAAGGHPAPALGAGGGGRRRVLAGAGLGLSAGLPGLGLGLWAPAPAWAQPGVDRPPEPQAARPVQVPPLVVQRLGNGVGVVAVPQHDLPLVSAQLMVRAGRELDPADRAGTASMLATLLGKGVRRGGKAVSATAQAREAEALGGPLVTASGWRSLSVGMTVATPQLPAALALLAEALRRPVLAADELDRARAQALDNLRVALGNPGELAAMALRRSFWGHTPYGAVATMAALQRLGRADVQQFHARHVRPEHTVLVLAGDVSAERAAQLAQQLLGDWEPSGALLPMAPADAPQPQAAPLLLVDLPGSGQSGVALAAPYAAIGAAERRVGQVANAVLGGGYSARLNAAVRIRRGLSYGAYSDVESTPGGGMLVASTQTAHATAAEALAVMRAELLRLAASPPAADELAARQAALAGGFARGLQTTQGLAALVSTQLANGRPLAELQRFVPEVMAVTPEQVQAFARQHWQPERLRAVVVGDLAAAGPAFQAPLPAGTLRVNADQLDLDQPGFGAG